MSTCWTAGSVPAVGSSDFYGAIDHGFGVSVLGEPLQLDGMAGAVGRESGRERDSPWRRRAFTGHRRAGRARRRPSAGDSGGPIPLEGQRRRDIPAGSTALVP